jgi:hypothetical protein
MLNLYRQLSSVPPRSRPSRHSLETLALWVDNRATAGLDRRSTL